MRIEWLTLSSTLALVVMGCGGTSESVLSSDSGTDGTVNDGHASTDVSADTSKDSSKDAAATDTSSSDTATDTATDAVTDSASDAGGCVGVAATDCVACCTKAHGTGRGNLETLELDCACKSASLCGPIDAGSTDGGAKDGGPDTSVLGRGECTASCPTHLDPSVGCVVCLDEATGTKATPKTCYDSVAKGCASDKACTAYVACVATCGG
jgi:hypothetical protein